MGLTRAERIALHKKQEKLTVRDGDTPQVGDLKEGVPVLRSNNEGLVEYVRHNSILYKRTYTGIGTGVENQELAIANSMAFTPGTNPQLSRMSGGNSDKPNFDIEVVGDITLKPKGSGNHVYFKNGSSTTVDIDCNGSTSAGASITLNAIEEDTYGGYFRIDTSRDGVTEIKTVDDDAAVAHLTLTVDGDTKFVPTGTVIIDKDWSDTTATTLYGLQVDFDKTGASTSNNTMYGLEIDMDNATATDGVNIMTGLRCTPTLTHNADAGTSLVTGGSFTVTGASNGASTANGLYVTTAGAATLIGIDILQAGGKHLRLRYDGNNYSDMSVASDGKLTIATVGAGTTDSDITLDCDGDIILDAAGANWYLSIGGSAYHEYGYNYYKLMNTLSDAGDYFKFSIASDGATLFETVDDSGNNAALIAFSPQGNIELNPGANSEFRVNATTKTASGTTDSTAQFLETLNLGSGAGGSDVHYGLRYTQTQTDLTGWDSVYLMHLTGGSGKILSIDNNANLTLSNDRKVVFGDAGEYIAGDGTDLDIVSSNDATINAVGTIILDSADGTFEMHGAGATAKFADMYAGMILGYTDIGLNESHTSLDLTTSYVVPTDEFSVSFVAPPSGNVMIDFQIQYYMGSTGAGTLHAGLSTANATSGYAALQSYHEQMFDDSGVRSAITTIHGSWTVTGLTAGAATEYWIGFKTASTAGTTAYISWGGNIANRYPGFIIKATALPASITT